MAKYYFNHPYFVHGKEKSINNNNNNKKTNPEGCEQPQPWKKKKASQVINRDAGGRSFLHFHLFLVRDAVGGGGFGRAYR